MREVLTGSLSELGGRATTEEIAVRAGVDSERALSSLRFMHNVTRVGEGDKLEWKIIK